MNFHKFVCIFQHHWRNPYTNLHPSCCLNVCRSLSSHHRNIPVVVRNFSGMTKYVTQRKSTASSNPTKGGAITNQDKFVQKVNNTPVTFLTKEKQSKEKDDCLLPSEKEQRRLLQLKDDILSSEDDSIFDIYAKNKSSYEIHHYMNTMKRISELYTKGLISSNDLYQKPEFESICYDLWKMMSQIEAREVLQLYKYLQQMEVDQTFLIMQSLLQMMRHQINLLDVKSLAFLQVLLDKTEPCNLKKALEAAIPVVLENHFKIYVNTNLTHYEVFKLLKICSRGQLIEIGQLLKDIHNYHLPKLLCGEDDQNFVFNLISLIQHLLEIPLNILDENGIHTTDRLVQKCLEELSQNGFSTITQKQMLSLLQALSDGYVRGTNFVTDDEFLTATSSHALSQMWELNTLLRIVALQLSMHFVDDQLVSFIVQNLKQEITSYDQVPNSLIIILISAIASSEVPLVDSQPVVRSLIDRYDYSTIDKKYDIPWIRVALNLLSLHIVPEALLNKILEQEFLTRCLAVRSFALHELLDLQRLNRALKVMARNTSVRIPEQYLKLLEENLRTWPSLTNQLRGLVKDETCMATNVLLPSGAVIDHLLILDEAGCPLSILDEAGCPLSILDEAGCPLSIQDSGTNSYKVTALSSLKNTHSGNRIALMEIPKSWMCNPGMRRLRGYFRLEIELLSKEGFRVVPLYEKEINAMEPELILMYLKKRLQESGLAL